jgi:hypothetical protein
VDERGRAETVGTLLKSLAGGTPFQERIDYETAIETNQKIWADGNNEKTKCLYSVRAFTGCFVDDWL